MYQLSQKTIRCSNHPLAKNAYDMHEGKVTVPNKLDPKHPLTEEYLTCSRCFQTIRITPEIRLELEALKNDGLITIPTTDIITKDSKGKITYDRDISPTTPASYVS